NNGGPTRTMALLGISQAIGNGTSVSGISSDQRGIARPSGTADIGAYQTQALAIDTQPASATIDNGQTDSLRVVATLGAPPYSYQWYTGTSGDTSHPIAGAVNSSYNAAPTSTTTYWVQVSDGSSGPHNKVNSKSATIAVNPALTVTKPAGATIAFGQSAAL